jgi:hypothetical protein
MVALPFSISPVNQDLILYSCTKAPALEEGLVETRCGNGTFARVGGRSGESYGSYFLDGCGATVVPVLGNGKYAKANASGYEELISGGFLLTWQTPPESSKLHSCSMFNLFASPPRHRVFNRVASCRCSVLGVFSGLAWLISASNDN